jgi:hypothetical protein
MGDGLTKVRSGEPLRFPAAAYNAFVDAALDYQRRQRNLLGRPTSRALQADIILVKNTTDNDLDRFSVLGIDAPVFLPADAPETFANDIAVLGVSPTWNGHAGRFIILAEPLAAGAMGRAWAHGVCPTKLDVQNEAHGYADVADSLTTLRTATTGSARILWKEDGTGTKWAIVRLGGGMDGFWAVLTTTPPAGWSYGALTGPRYFFKEQKVTRAPNGTLTFEDLPNGRHSVATNLCEQGAGVDQAIFKAAGTAPTRYVFIRHTNDGDNADVYTFESHPGPIETWHHLEVTRLDEDGCPCPAYSTWREMKGPAVVVANKVMPNPCT